MLYSLEMLSIKNNEIYDNRIFGVFTEDKLSTLRNIIINNVTDIWEFYYKYAVIFKVPENTLYIDCYASLFEVYKVVIPEQIIQAKNLTSEQKLAIEKQYIDDVKFEKVHESEIPEYIKNRYKGLEED